jgi:hypothetical protein
LPGKVSAWVGNGWTQDGTIAANEADHEFVASRSITITTFYCAILNGTAGAGQTLTFQVFDSTNAAVGSGASATCVIPASGSSALNTSASISLTGGQLYAVKVTSSSGNVPGKPAAWNLGN